MNFVVAALILARFHELSTIAAASELNEDAWPPPSPEQVEEYVPNYQAEADVFWLFQVASRWPHCSPHTVFSRSCPHSNLMDPSPQLSQGSLSRLGGQSQMERSSAWHRSGLMAFPR
jgi:hypothetical protein